MRIVAGTTSSGGERPMDITSLELVLFVAPEAKRLLRLQQPRKPSFGRDLMAGIAQIFFCQQTIHF
jgi:hypothetical protein